MNFHEHLHHAIVTLAATLQLEPSSKAFGSVLLHGSSTTYFADGRISVTVDLDGSRRDCISWASIGAVGVEVAAEFGGELVKAAAHGKAVAAAIDHGLAVEIMNIAAAFDDKTEMLDELRVIALG